MPGGVEDFYLKWYKYIAFDFGKHTRRELKLR